MRTYNFDDENKTIKTHKDCVKCQHINVCVFHKNIKEVASTNIMYQMNEYLESNNVLRVFEYYGSCKHYIPKYNFEFDEPPTLLSDLEVINHIVYNHVRLVTNNLLEEKYPEHKSNAYFFFSPSVKIDVPKDNYVLKLQTTNKEIGHGTVVYENTFSISNILKDWKFIKNS